MAVVPATVGWDYVRDARVVLSARLFHERNGISGGVNGCRWKKASCDRPKPSLVAQLVHASSKLLAVMHIIQSSEPRGWNMAPQFAARRGDVVRKKNGGDDIVRAIYSDKDGELTYAVEKRERWIPSVETSSAAAKPGASSIRRHRSRQDCRPIARSPLKRAAARS